MGKRTGYRLGDLQLRILKVLWRDGSASVADVHAALALDSAGENSPAPLAYTTVATMLRKMEAKGLVDHHEDGRRFIYFAAVTAEDVNRSTTEDVVERLFEGSLAETVSHLLQTREVSLEELDRLEQLIQQRKRQPNMAGPRADRRT
jgi:BlaI family transcriptional regulator, penicillinase repressor